MSTFKKKTSTNLKNSILGINLNDTLISVESNWKNLGVNFDKLLEHLERANREVTEASIGCLEALSDCVSSTCNQVDVGIKVSKSAIFTNGFISERVIL